MIKTFLFFNIVLLFLLTSINSFSKEQDPIISQMEKLKQCYVLDDFEKSLKILSEIEINLKNKNIQKNKNGKNLISFKEMIFTAFFLNKTSWDLSITHQHSEYITKDSETVAKKLFLMLQNKKKQLIPKQKDVDINSIKMAIEYHKNISKLLQTLRYKRIRQYLFTFKDDDIPIQFVNFHNQICLIIENIANDNIYNTLKTTAKERAAMEIANIIINFKDFYDCFKDTDIQYYGLFFTYGSKDFSDESIVFNLEPESILLLASKNDCAKFYNGEMSENKFLNRSYIFMSDRDISGEYKRIEVEIK